MEYRRNSYAYSVALRKRGFESLGDGSFSEVLAKPCSDRVVKVNHDLDEWPCYIKWAEEKGWAGKYAPKVFSYTYRHGFYVAVTERLVQKSWADVTGAEINATNFIRYPNDGGIDFDALDEDYPGLREFMGDLRERFNRQSLDLLSRGNILYRPLASGKDQIVVGPTSLGCRPF